MYSDPKDCLYCTNNETLHNLMIEIAHLRVSRAFLFKEQTYHEAQIRPRSGLALKRDTEELTQNIRLTRS